MLAISAGLQAQIAKNPALVGPLTGRNKQALAKLGLGDAGVQKMLDDVSLLQSAVTKMHTGRFSNEILKKSGSLVSPGMNAATGATTPESVNPKTLFTKVNRLYDRGRLTQAIGQENAENLLRHVDSAYVQAQKIAAPQQWLKTAGKVVGLGTLGSAGVGLAHHLLGSPE